MTNIAAQLKGGYSLKIDHEELSDFEKNLIDNGKPKIVPAELISRYTWETALIGMQLNSIYVWPTTELLTWLNSNLTEKDKTIEIGSGNGVLANELGISATDSYMQSDKFKPNNSSERELHQNAIATLRLSGIPPINYGANVEQLDALAAIRKHKPKHILGCYITHKYINGMSTGNALGVDETWIARRKQIKSYTMVGNQVVHAEKPILALPHEEIELDGLIVRAKNPAANRIFRWDFSTETP